MISQWSVDDLSMICQWSVNDLSMICQWFVDDLPIICQWSDDDLSIIWQCSVRWVERYIWQKNGDFHRTAHGSLGFRRTTLSLNTTSVSYSYYYLQCLNAPYTSVVSGTTLCPYIHIFQITVYRKERWLMRSSFDLRFFRTGRFANTEQQPWCLSGASIVVESLPKNGTFDS